MGTYRNRKNRQGVVLLIILGLLAMFGMTAVTLVLVTGHHQRAATTAARIGQHSDPPEKLLEEAMYQVIRGTKSPASVIGPWSLLEDLYGNRVAAASLTAAQPIAGGQLFECTFVVPNPPGNWRPYDAAGCVLTMLTGPAAGHSTRILSHVPPEDTNGNGVLDPGEPDYNQNGLADPEKWIVLAFEGAATGLLPVGDCLINGVPFSGTGAGYNPGSGRCDGQDSDPVIAGLPSPKPIALLPNPSAYSAGVDPLGSGGANEDYDAVDYQNMLLAMQLPDGSVPSPSLHRPALINYWVYRLVYDWLAAAGMPPADAWRAVLRPTVYAPNGPTRDTIISLVRKIVFRPLGGLHPQFDSDPVWLAWEAVDISAFDEGQLRDYWANCPLLAGPWDVDNDGDGVRDSLWVDLGLPVRTLPDGRHYKPLFAILCVDMDGRLNLNAHGRLAQTQAAYYEPPHAIAQTFLNGANANDDRKLAEGTPTSSPAGVDALSGNDLLEYLRHGIRGGGFGPAEVNLLPLFGVPAGVSDYAETLTGIVLPSGERLDGRYGEAHMIGVGPSGVAQPGVTNIDDPLSFNKMFNYPSSYPLFNVPHRFGTPLDFAGYMTYALDLYGQPVYMAYDGAWNGWLLDDPYELDLSRRAAAGLPTPAPVDNRFTAAELERLLRPFDIDTHLLPDRLAMLLAYDQSSPAPNLTALRNLARSFVFNRRLEVTTDSWDLPVPNVVRTPMGSAAPGHAAELVAAQLRAAGMNETAIAQQLQMMLSPELLAGLRLDLNRPLGNRRDDNGNWAVDEMAEATSGTEQLQLAGPAGPVTFLLDHDNDGVPGATVDPRVIIARSLYVLAMALTDNGYNYTWLGSGEQRAHYLAQWAVNVVDFADRDSIMTRFVYDPQPFDAAGWNPTGNDVVWGCERPEILISEAKAFHDRRTEDTAQYGYAYPGPGDPKEEEQNDMVRDLDQVYRPQGSVFVELYNPWQNADPNSQLEPANELYTGNGVDLGKRAPDGTPVWRLAFTGDQPIGQEPPDPDDPNAAARPAIERVTYFVDEAAPGPATGSGVQFYTSVPPAQPLLPGRYAVVGPGGPPNGGITFLGWETNGTQDINSTRHIVCDPGANPQFIVRHNNTAVPPGVRAPMAIMIDRATNDGVNFRDQRLSITEPVTGYPNQVDADGQGTMANYRPGTGDYDTIIDVPLDSTHPDWNTILGRDVTVTAYRMAHLQRLADPTRPYDAVLNPYLTVDSTPVDLTSFSGRSNDDDFGVGAQAGQQLQPLTVMFATRQRGESNDDPDLSDAVQYNDAQLWKQEPRTKSVVDPGLPAVANHYFDKQLVHSLGYLNQYLGAPRQDSNPPPTAPSPVYQGAPDQPFPWLTWLNRPYTSPLEVLLVPALRSSKLLACREDNVPSNPAGREYYRYFRIVDRDIPDPTDPTKTDADRVDQYNPILDPANPNYAPWKVAFPHLANMFHSRKLAPAPAGPTAPELHRILEYICVPSPFVGTELQCNPVAMQGNPLHKYHPPGQMISNYREPGKVNLNTVFSEAVWQGLLNLPVLRIAPTPNNDENGDGNPQNDPPDRLPLLASGFDPSASVVDDPDGIPNTGDELYDFTLWDRLVQSRRGYGGTPLGNPLVLDPRYPTRFANPFRSFAGAHLVPIDTLQASVGREANATLLRKHPASGLSTPPLPGEVADRPLFEIESVFDPTASPTQPCNWNNTDRNPFFRYQHLMRLGNLVTTRSNVYAVWITLGYFEVEPAPGGVPSTWYPDGWQLGPELGSDTGEIRRHRLFFMVDRTIPVGFQRGRDLNVQNAVLVKRMIE